MASTERRYRGVAIERTPSSGMWIAWTPGGRWPRVMADTLDGIRHMIRASLDDRTA